MWVRALVDADASCGGKAVGLARLIAAGARVPAGFVLDARAFAALAGAPIDDDRDGIGHALADAAARIAAADVPAELVAEVARRIDVLGAGNLLAVRSSATIEDGEAGAAAGVFSSRRAVAPADVWDAIRAVWTSALTPLAASYARRRGGTIAIGVIVQRFVPGTRVTVYTRPAGAPTADEVWLQRGAHVDRRARGDLDPIVVAAIAAEHAIGATAGADVELVEPADADAAPWLVQARPLVHPIAHARRPAPPTVTAALVADGRRWTWDLAHNPDPLSPAQAGLVERVERAACAPWSLRVCGGYLYTAARADAPAPPAPPHDRAELVARATAIEAELARTLGVAPSLDAPAPLAVPSLADAIAHYLAFYAIWAGTLSPLIAAARTPLRAAIADDESAARWLGARPSAVEATLAAAARGELDDATVLARLGALSPCWDVATPTFAERPGVLRDAIARAVAIPRAETPPAPPAELARAVELARAAADLAERDDLWFARAQQLVRRALRAHAAALGIDADDAAWLPLHELAAATAPATTIDRDDAHRRASATRAAVARAASWDMPAIVGGAPPIARAALHGVGTGGRVTGRVVRFASLASAIAVGAGDIIVTRAVTPALAVLVTGCAALVSESGGLLDHGAALARELGIPCVVGCVGAWATLADGALVTVDGASGRVTAIDAAIDTGEAQSSSSS